MPVRTQQNKFWYFPFVIANWSNSQKKILRTILQLNPNTEIAIPNWGNYPLRKRHLWRSDFQKYQENIHLPFNMDFDNLVQNISVLILAGGSYLPWSESELIHLAQHRIPIIIDEDQAQRLEAPWIHGDQIWILSKKQIREDLLMFMDKNQSTLTFESLQNLSYFQDHRSNQLLRAFSEKFNLIE
jgi:hypothetical protein